MSPRVRRAVVAVQTWPRRSWRFVMAPVTDKPDYDLSLTRLLAIYFALVIGHSIEQSPSHALSGTQLTLALATYAVAFGKATFTFFLARSRFNANLEQRDSTSRVDVTQRFEAHEWAEGRETGVL